MKIKSSLMLLVFLMASIFQVINAASHYYIKIKKSWIEIGEYSGKFKKQPVKSYPLDQLNPDSLQKFMFADTSEKILFYFHAMWGGQKEFHRHSLRKLNTIEGVDKVISILWFTDKLGYKGSWKLAIHQGEQLSSLLEELTNNDLNQNYVLCHSMGHRIFEGVVKNMEDSNSRFEAVFFTASDLDTDVFANNLSTLPALSNHVVIYVHKKDRMLKASKIAHGRDRLGLNALSHKAEYEQFQNVELIDITHSKNGLKFSVSNHIYFKNHKKVFNDIAYVINDREEERLGHIKKREGQIIELK